MKKIIYLLLICLLHSCSSSNKAIKPSFISKQNINNFDKDNFTYNYKEVNKNSFSSDQIIISDRSNNKNINNTISANNSNKEVYLITKKTLYSAENLKEHNLVKLPIQNTKLSDEQETPKNEPLTTAFHLSILSIITALISSVFGFRYFLKDIYKYNYRDPLGASVALTASATYIYSTVSSLLKIKNHRSKTNSNNNKIINEQTLQKEENIIENSKSNLIIGMILILIGMGLISMLGIFYFLTNFCMFC